MDTPAHEKYLQKPFIGSSHSWAKQQIGLLTRPTRALDIGSGSGVMGATLKELGTPEVYAVEPDPQARAQTASLYTGISDSLHTFAGRQFDLILLLDVLEHMPDPVRFMRELMPVVAPGGTILFSVPNVAHWSVRIPLLLGEFRYRERGILDKTHLHFFTRNSFRGFLRQISALDLVSEAVSIPPVEFLLPHAIWDSSWYRALSKIRHQTAQIMPGLLGYQLLTVAKKRTDG